MSEPLHTKYRPKTLAGIVGHDRVVSSLQKIVNDDACQVFLFGGPPGVGKTTLARIVSKALGCLEDETVELSGAEKPGAEDMRELLERYSFGVMRRGRALAIIVDECQALSKAAFQVLLKALEEPLPSLYWFFCTSELPKVPVAFRRRCATYELSPVKDEYILALLKEVVRKENIATKEENLVACVSAAEGSPGQALMNLTTCLAAANGREAREVLSTATDSPQAIQLARLLVESSTKWRDVSVLLTAMKTDNTNPESVRQVVKAYMTTVILARSLHPHPTHLRVLEAFSKPFYGNDGLALLVLACASVCMDR